jgi:hypothetical protein
LTLVGFIPSAEQPAILQVSPPNSRIRVGQRAIIELTVDQVSGIYGAEIHLRFDPKVLQVVDADPGQEGTQLELGTLPSPDFVVQNRADNTAGTIDYAVTQLPPTQPGQGEGVIARVTFEAKQAAVSQVQFEQFVLADTEGRNIVAVAQNGQIQVANTSTWILGAAIGLPLAFLAIGIGWILNKRK